jgi:hypothetical protein
MHITKKDSVRIMICSYLRRIFADQRQDQERSSDFVKRQIPKGWISGNSRIFICVKMKMRESPTHIASDAYHDINRRAHSGRDYAALIAACGSPTRAKSTGAGDDGGSSRSKASDVRNCAHSSAVGWRRAVEVLDVFRARVNSSAGECTRPLRKLGGGAHRMPDGTAAAMVAPRCRFEFPRLGGSVVPTDARRASSTRPVA